VGAVAAGRGRATGASTVTGGRFDCCASAPENEATAIIPATAETFRPEQLSNFSLTEFIAALERSDLGVFALFIPRAPTEFQIADAVHSRISDGALVSSEKIRVNAIAALEWLNRSRSNRF
jgi:hypothetical protein